jgi:hypothetical protein
MEILSIDLSEYVLTMVQIHASTINNDPDRVIRLATDLRFVDSSKPYDTVSSDGHNRQYKS